MSFIDLLRSSRSSRIAVLHKFLTNYDPTTQRVYGFVEGEPDQAFYRIQVQRHTARLADVYIYNCEGKQNVYAAYKDVIARYPDCRRVLFFVDKDVDDIIAVRWPADPRIFVTECYSIENYVVCREALALYFQDFVKIRRVDVHVDAILTSFDQNQRDFHQLVLPIMAWIVAMRRAGCRVTLRDVNLSELFAVSDDGVSRLSRQRPLAYLSRVTQTAAEGPVWRQVRAVYTELKRIPPKSYVRGKFEAWWFVEFGRRIAEGLQRVAKEVGGSVSFSAQLNQSTFIQLLTAGVPPPENLETFLRFHLDRPAGPSTPVRTSSARGLSLLKRILAFYR